MIFGTEVLKLRELGPSPKGRAHTQLQLPVQGLGPDHPLLLGKDQNPLMWKKPFIPMEEMKSFFHSQKKLGKQPV